MLKTTAEVEKEVVDAKGEKTKELVPAGKVVPGTEVVWTVTANNICKQPSDKVIINNPVPEHMTLVPNSAFGPGSDVTYSVDGKTFAPAGQAHGAGERRHASRARRRIQTHSLGVQERPAARRERLWRASAPC